MQFIDKKKAQELLRQLPYEQWLPLGRMMVPKGVHTSRVGSLEELEWSIRPTAKTLVAMRFGNLEKWLRDSVGDVELADQVKSFVDEDLTYVETSKKIYEAVLARVTTLKQIAAEEVSDA